LFRAGSSSSATGRRARRLPWRRAQEARHTVLDRPEGESPACPLAPADSCLLLAGAEATAPESLPAAAIALGDEGLEHQLVVI
jgi:hypothetical protein